MDIALIKACMKGDLKYLKSLDLSFENDEKIIDCMSLLIIHNHLECIEYLTSFCTLENIFLIMDLCISSLTNFKIKKFFIKTYCIDVNLSQIKHTIDKLVSYDDYDTLSLIFQFANISTVDKYTFPDKFFEYLNYWKNTRERKSVKIQRHWRAWIKKSH